MEFFEKDLEQIIYETSNELLNSKGLNIKGKKLRQLRIGNFGISDLVTYHKTNFNEWVNDNYYVINVYELKKDKVGISALLQAIRYCKGIKTYLEQYKPNINFKLNITLISKEVDKTGDFIYITDLINNESYKSINSISFYSFKYNVNGIEFNKESGYNLIDKGF